jgi:hypothetical protein
VTTKAALLKKVRGKCLDCCCYQPREIAKCTAYTCVLWPFRFGRDPIPARKGFAKNPTARREVFRMEPIRNDRP